MTRPNVAATLAAALLAAGCGGSSAPTQTKLSEAEVQDLMKQGKEQSQQERGTRKPGT